MYKCAILMLDLDLYVVLAFAYCIQYIKGKIKVHFVIKGTLWCGKWILFTFFISFFIKARACVLDLKKKKIS